MSPGEGFVKVIPAAVGFGLGAMFIFGLDKVLPHIHINFKESEELKRPGTEPLYWYWQLPYQYTRGIGSGSFVWWSCCRDSKRPLQVCSFTRNRDTKFP